MSGDGIGFNLAIGSSSRRPWVDYVPGFSDCPPPYYPGYGRGHDYNDNHGYNGGYWDYDVTTNPLNLLYELERYNFHGNHGSTRRDEPPTSRTQPEEKRQSSSASNPSAVTLSSEEVRAQRDRARRLINGGSADGSGATFADQITKAIDASRTREKELRAEAQKARDNKVHKQEEKDKSVTLTVGQKRSAVIDGIIDTLNPYNWFTEKNENNEGRHFSLIKTATTLGTIVIGAAICATGPVGIAVVAGAGLMMGAAAIKSGVDKTYTAKTEDEAKAAYAEIGGGAAVAGMSLIPGGFKGIKGGIKGWFGKRAAFKDSKGAVSETVAKIKDLKEPKPVEKPAEGAGTKPAEGATPEAAKLKPVSDSPELVKLLDKIDKSGRISSRTKNIEAVRAYVSKHPEYDWLLPELEKIEAMTPERGLVAKTFGFLGKGYSEHPFIALPATWATTGMLHKQIDTTLEQAKVEENKQKQAELDSAGKAERDEADKLAKAGLDELKQLAEAWGVKSDDIKKIEDAKLDIHKQQDKIKELTIAAQTKLNNDFQVLYDEPMPASINSAAQAQAAIKAKKDAYIASAAKVGLLTKDDMTLEEIVDAGKKAQDKLQADEQARQKNVVANWLN